MSRDLDRLRGEYSERDTRLAGSDRYSYFNSSYLFEIQQRQRHLLDMLKKTGITSWHNQNILEVGCGAGGVLTELLSLGVSAGELAGCDLIFERVASARRKLPHVALVCADAQALPYSNQAFDFVLLYTVLSSILDSEIKQNIASEIDRVLRPGGFVIWYDFWFNPQNRQTKGIRPAEVRALFPGYSFIFRKITLAPPLTRHLVRVSWFFCSILEQMRVFNSHYLAMIQKK